MIQKKYNEYNVSHNIRPIILQFLWLRIKSKSIYTSKGKVRILISFQKINSLIITKFLSPYLNQQLIVYITSKFTGQNISWASYLIILIKTLAVKNLKISGWSIIHITKYCNPLCDFITFPQSPLISLIKRLQENNDFPHIVLFSISQISYDCHSSLNYNCFLILYNSYIVPWSSYYLCINTIILKNH